MRSPSRIEVRPETPSAFTEHGAIMLANVLKNPSAIGASIQVVRAFIRLREILSAYRELAKRLDELERRYDARFKTVFDAIRDLMGGPPSEEPPRKIGFDPG